MVVKTRNDVIGKYCTEVASHSHTKVLCLVYKNRMTCSVHSTKVFQVGRYVRISYMAFKLY